MQMGLWLSAAAILVSASSPLSNQFRVVGKDAIPLSPPTWSDPIVLTQVAGTNTSDVTLEVGSNVYVDIAVFNNGDATILDTFDACLYLDITTLVNCWTIPAGLTPSTYSTVEDYVMATAVSEGSHSLELRIGVFDVIAGEADTTNNSFTADFTWVESTPSATAGALMADAFTAGPLNMPADVNGDSNAPDLSDTSAYMIGKVAVSVILPESNGVGSTENWSQTEIDQVKAEIQASLDNWAAWYTTYLGSNPGLNFVIEWHTNADLVPVSVPDDPIAFVGGMSDEDQWINQALTALSVPLGDGNHFKRAYAYNNTIRTANSADWAFTIFVVDSSADPDGRFLPVTTGPFAYSYLNGPYLVMTYDNANWGISQMNEVLAHQVAHIFGAADQYTGCSGGDASTPFGYLAIANSNCGGTGPSLMLTGQGSPDITTRQQAGWRDTDADQIFDPADTRPAITGFIDETPSATGTNHIFSGIAYDNPWPATKPITIRKLIAIEYSVDGGAWQPATITSGTLDSDREGFDFATPNNLGGGIHTVDVRARNNSTDPINQYSAVGADQVGISRIILTFSNDFFASPVIISSLPFTSSGIDTTTYTTGELNRDKDLIACGGDINVNRIAGDHSAWYRYTPTTTESVTLDTIGSNVAGDTAQFDTMIGVYLEEGDVLTQIDCDDDSAGNLKSIVTAPFASGRTYYFVVSSFNGIPVSGAINASSGKPGVNARAGDFDPGGTLVFHATSNGVILDAPFVVSSVRANPNPTTLGTVDFTVTFSEPVTGVDEGDFSLTTSGILGAAVSGISGSGSTYTVSVNTGNGSGTLHLNVDSNGTITNASSYPLSAGFTSGETYTIDKTSPTVLSSLRADPNPTAAASVNFTVTFSESMAGVDVSDFSLTTSGVSGAAISGISGSGSTYTVSVITGSGNGTIRLDVVNNGSIINGSLYPLAAGYTSGQKYRFFNPVPPPTNPLVNSILPTSRSIPVGSLATIYNAVINGGTNIAYAVTLTMNPQPAGTFSYMQTDCGTNAIIGEENEPVDVPVGGVVCYVLLFVPDAPFAATSAHIKAQAINSNATNLLTGINTWLLRASTVPGPDTVALTTTTDFHQVSCSGTNAFAVALSNVGVAATGDITASANTGATALPVTVLIQETNPATGVIIGDNILQNLGAGENRTVVVFVTFRGCIGFDPAANRIFIEFRDASNNVVGSTSTAISTGR